MTSIVDLYQTNSGFVEEKGLQQIIAMCGEGRLFQSSPASEQFRQLLAIFSPEILKRCIEECLTQSFQDSGMALQDLVNEIGARLGFVVQPGRYRGNRDKIGHDGLWKAQDGSVLVIEVKTTDAYRINLDTVARYRFRLIEEQDVRPEDSSILIVVGRQDTGDLEAQIRGSRHAWDIRVISIDALLRLLDVRQNLSEPATIRRISGLLRPLEYTRVDELVDLVFLTFNEPELEVPQVIDPTDGGTPGSAAPSRAAFHDDCIQRVARMLGTPLIKDGRTLWTSADRDLHVMCSVSRSYETGDKTGYWYAFHPSQAEYLGRTERAFVVFGCGDPSRTIVIPYPEFKPLLDGMWTTESKGRVYWHVKIYEDKGRYTLHLGKADGRVDITERAVMDTSG
jgi:hypothetical protein